MPPIRSNLCLCVGVLGGSGGSSGCENSEKAVKNEKFCFMSWFLSSISSIAKSVWRYMGLQLFYKHLHLRESVVLSPQGIYS